MTLGKTCGRSKEFSWFYWAWAEKSTRRSFHTKADGHLLDTKTYLYLFEIGGGGDTRAVKS